MRNDTGEPGSGGLAEFRRRMYAQWLPAFCDAKDLDRRGFVDASCDKLHEIDAGLFLQAIDAQVISAQGAYFRAAQSGALEQIFWEGLKSEDPRRITLWLEPVITIGMLARLHREYGWPAEKLGAQSKDWAFDFVCLGEEGVAVAGEVKKTVRELDVMLAFMGQFGATPECPEPRQSVAKNAFRKARALRRLRPRRFCAVGPGGHFEVFGVDLQAEGRMTLTPLVNAQLSFAASVAS